MQERAKRLNLVEAVEDLKRRSLAPISGELTRLVYLASTRDYVTGRYYHDGLALRFTRELAEIAVGYCHRELFERVAGLPLCDVVGELDSFIQSQHTNPPEVLDTWKRLQPYRMLVPQDIDSVSREFFFSNIRIALAILENRLERSLDLDQQSASPQQ